MELLNKEHGLSRDELEFLVKNGALLSSLDESGDEDNTSAEPEQEEDVLSFYKNTFEAAKERTDGKIMILTCHIVITFKTKNFNY
jgi:hypothetical protein